MNHEKLLADTLERAIERLDDMLKGDDGQAWKEAERTMPALRQAIEVYKKEGGRRIGIPEKQEPTGIIVTEAELRSIYRSACAAELANKMVIKVVTNILKDAGLKP